MAWNAFFSSLRHFTLQSSGPTGKILCSRFGTLVSVIKMPLMIRRILHAYVSPVVLYVAISFLALANFSWAGPYESDTFIQYFKTNWVRECTWLTDSWPVPIAANSDIVAMIDNAGHLSCLYRSTGQTKWFRSISSAQQPGLIVAGNNIYVLTRGMSTIDAYCIENGSRV